jgi:hypothetical protein
MTIRQRLIVTALAAFTSLAGSTMLATRSIAQDELPGDGGGCNSKKCDGDSCESAARFNCVGGKAYYSISTGEYLGCSSSGTGTQCCSGTSC